MKWRRALGAMAIAGVIATTAAPTLAGPTSADWAFETWRTHWDRPVAEGAAERSWMWGHQITGSSDVEDYAEAEGDKRDVRYFDKARMEYWPNSEGDVFDVHAYPWKVTTGLLATELMTGQLQLGDDTFEQHGPSQVPVAGDPDTGDITPSYADMGKVMAYEPLPEGWTITQTIDANGNVGSDVRFEDYGVTAKDVGAPTGHTVASVFWVWMNQTGLMHHRDDGFVTERVFANPFYATGYPTTEAYWTQARVGGEQKDVLAQCFERRCLTYTPSNPEGWQVEMANIGQHYHTWRYTEILAEDPDQSGEEASPTPEPTPDDDEDKAPQPTPTPDGGEASPTPEPTTEVNVEATVEASTTP